MRLPCAGRSREHGCSRSRHCQAPHRTLQRGPPSHRPRIPSAGPSRSERHSLLVCARREGFEDGCLPAQLVHLRRAVGWIGSKEAGQRQLQVPEQQAPGPHNQKAWLCSCRTVAFNSPPSLLLS